MKKKLLVFIIIGCVIRISENKKIRRLVRIDRYEQCGRTQNAVLVSREVNIINPAGENALINFQAEILRDITEEPKLEIYITRCLSRESLDTCIPFTVLKPLSLCAALTMGNTAWSDFTKSFHPPVRCPIKAGMYAIVNGSMNADLFNFFPIDSYYWKTKFKYIRNEEYSIICIDLRAIKVYV